MRQQLGDTEVRGESTSQKKGPSGTRIPASAYTQMEHARREPAGIGVNTIVLTPNLSQREWTEFWLQRYEATRSVAGHERAFPPSRAAPGERDALVARRDRRRGGFLLERGGEESA